jgi:hypothetical protein
MLVCYYLSQPPPFAGQGAQAEDGIPVCWPSICSYIAYDAAAHGNSSMIHLAYGT